MALKIIPVDEPKEKTTVKTIVIWMDAGVKFFVVDGDYSHLHRKFMDGLLGTDQEREEIYGLAYKEEGTSRKPKVVMEKNFPHHMFGSGQVCKVIVTGYVP